MTEDSWEEWAVKHAIYTIQNLIMNNSHNLSKCHPICLNVHPMMHIPPQMRDFIGWRVFYDQPFDIIMVDVIF